MKIIYYILPFIAIALISCDRKKQAQETSIDPPESHEKAIEKFQDAQQRFKNVIATVRDEQSFDAALPDLEKVVSDWREVAKALQKLDLPSPQDQEKYQKIISEGNKRTEPTGEDMFSLISIESRETEIFAWFEEFASAGQEAGIELFRLYGQTDYSKQAAESQEIELDPENWEVKIEPTPDDLPVDLTLWRKSMNPGDHQDTEQPAKTNIIIRRSK